MSRYIRPHVTGATIFFTVALRERGSDLLVSRIERLRIAVREVREARPFEIDAWVVLTDHLPCVWSLPAGDCDFSRRWAAIESRFSRDLRTGRQRRSDAARREKAIWQHQFREHHIRDEADRQAHIRYLWLRAGRS